MAELVSTEQSYVAGLDTLRAVFYDPIRLLPPFILLKRPTRHDVTKSAQRVLTTDEIHAIFANVEAILEFHRQLLRKLEARFIGWNDSSTRVRGTSSAHRQRRHSHPLPPSLRPASLSSRPLSLLHL